MCKSALLRRICVMLTWYSSVTGITSAASRSTLRSSTRPTARASSYVPSSRSPRSLPDHTCGRNAA